MTLEEVNKYFSEMFYIYCPSAKEGEKHNILSVNYHTISKYIKDREYKLETFRHLLLNSRIITSMQLFKDNFITIEDILELQAKYGDIFYMLPDAAYKNNSKLIEYVLNEDSIMFDLLPSFVRNDARVQQKCRRTKAIYTNKGRDGEGYNIDWLNETGELIEFFKLKNGFPITSKEDYHTILKYYVTSGMSVGGFCYQYGITPVEGFQEFLKRCGIENTDTQELITENKAVASNKYVQTIKQIATYFNEKKITVTDYINDYYTPIHKIPLLLSFVTDKKEFMSQLLDYMYNNRAELKLDIIIDLLDSNIKKIRDDLKATIKLACGNQPDLVKKLYAIRLENYTYAFRRDQAKCKYIKEGKEYIIDDSIIDQAIAYADDNKIYRCSFTINDIAKRIAYGEIIYDKETIEKRKQLISSIIEIALSKAKDINDYMGAMEDIRSNIRI